MLVCNNTTCSNCGESSIVSMTFERFFRDAEVIRFRLQCMRCFSHHVFRLAYDAMGTVVHRAFVEGSVTDEPTLRGLKKESYDLLSHDHREEFVRVALKGLSTRPCPSWYFVSPIMRRFINHLMAVGNGHDGFLLDKEDLLRSVLL